jgi:tRNA modification GTPase
MTAELLQSFRLGNVIRNGVSVAIVGRPNAGKSTLLNTLLNEERAIVSEIAGTTRDTIEEILNIGGIYFRLIDTAGIRHHTSDVIEQIGVGRSLEKMDAADIVLYLFDVRAAREAARGELTGSWGEDRRDLDRVREDLIARGKVFLLVGNKVDEFAGVVEARYPEEVLISARDGRGVDVLKQRLVELVLKGETAIGEGTLVTNARHYASLGKVAEALVVIRKGLDDLLPGDLLALDIRVCLHYLGEITGEITTEERLGYIFSKFCIGK